MLLGISLFFLSDSCDGRGIPAGLDPTGGNPGNFLVDGGSGEATKVYSKEKKGHQKSQHQLEKHH